MKKSHAHNVALFFVYFYEKLRPMHLAYRKCTIEDLSRLVQISKTTFIEAFEKDNRPDDFKAYIDFAFSQNKLADELGNPHTSFYFTYLNDEVVGYFKLNTDKAQSDLKQNDSIELERIYVDKDFQGMGIGKRVLEKVKSLASKTMKTFLWLGVWERNIKAIAFYEKHGFKKFGKHPYFIGNDKQMDWLMRFELTKLSRD